MAAFEQQQGFDLLDFPLEALLEQKAVIMQNTSSLLRILKHEPTPLWRCPDAPLALYVVPEPTDKAARAALEPFIVRFDDFNETHSSSETKWESLNYPMPEGASRRMRSLSSKVKNAMSTLGTASIAAVAFSAGQDGAQLLAAAPADAMGGAADCNETLLAFVFSKNRSTNSKRRMSTGSTNSGDQRTMLNSGGSLRDVESQTRRGQIQSLQNSNSQSLSRVFDFSSSKNPNGAEDLNATSNVSDLFNKANERAGVILRLIGKMKNDGEIKQTVIHKVNLEAFLTGARGVPVLLWDSSAVDAHEGLMVRGYKIQDLLKQLPKKDPEDQSPMVEGLIWLMYTGEIPLKHEAMALQKEIAKRQQSLAFEIKRLLPMLKGLPPMDQFIIGMMCLSSRSRYRAVVSDPKQKPSVSASFDDAITAISFAPILATAILKGSLALLPKSNFDFGANWARMLGLKGKESEDVMRLYSILHSDHEGGPASSHAANVVASTQADVFTSIAGGMCALSGRLHGAAAEQSLAFILNMANELSPNLHGDDLKKQVTNYVSDIISKKGLCMGIGHAVLQCVDTRFAAEMDFVEHYEIKSRLLEIVKAYSQAASEEIMKQKKRLMFANVDCGSGALLHSFGITDPAIFTAFFGASRTIGIACQHFWANLLASPLERVKSLTVDGLRQRVTANYTGGQERVTEMFKEYDEFTAKQREKRDEPSGRGKSKNSSVPRQSQRKNRLPISTNQMKASVM